MNLVISAPNPAAANNEPEAVSLIENTPAPTADSVNIEDGDTPLAVEQTWALLNLIMTIITGIISAVLLAGWFGKKRTPLRSLMADSPRMVMR